MERSSFPGRAPRTADIGQEPALGEGSVRDALPVVPIGLVAYYRRGFVRRSIIAIGGMLRGNCMRGIIVSLERFYAGSHEGEKGYLTYIFMGATISEAPHRHVRKALPAALAPMVSAMATMGIVAPRGMMTRQIIGGSDPTTAITYQMDIMVIIFVAVSLGAYLNSKLSTRVAFTDRGTLRDDVMTRRG